jgi:hypothetical protein
MTAGLFQRGERHARNRPMPRHTYVYLYGLRGRPANNGLATALIDN